MPDQYWVGPVAPFHAAVGAAFGTFTTYQDVSPTPLPVVFGYQLRIGSKIELEAEGEYTCATGITLSIGFTFGAVAGAAGGVILGQSGVITTGTTPTAWPWHAKYRGVVVGVGSAGSIVGNGVLDLGTSLTTFSNNAIPVTQALRTVAIDTTVAKLLGVGASYGTSGAGNTIKTNGFSALLLN